MPNINILSPHVADLIAAGEVVERPASVVKELIENSIDAGARNITLEISCGGMAEIKISDDGSGMSPEDVGICHLRHATSKITDERDLENIGTLGFRGEALAAISAVSRMEITTRREGDEFGTELVLEASDIISMQSVGCASGTTITVRDLFYNTPARQKFMKSDRAEASACVSVAQKCALAHPETSIRCLRDGKEAFFTAGDNRLSSVSYSILGREVGADMIEVCDDYDGISIKGFVCAPHNCRGNRSLQYFFVNGRNIRSFSLQTALENAYKNTSMTGRYPACVLHINIGLSAVDVNVHPTKAEVRFSSEKQIFSRLYYAVLSAINKPEEPKEDTFTAKTELFMTENEPKQREINSFYPKNPPPKDATYRILSAEEYSDLFLAGGVYSEPKPVVIPKRKDFTLNDFTAEAPTAIKISQPEPEKMPEKIPEKMPVPEVTDFRMIGETMGTYILAERSEELFFIDKHAAHERIIFDRLKQSGLKPMSQKLIEPIVFRINSADDEDFVRLTELGFEIEPFGMSDAIIRAIPSIIQASQAVSTIEELLENPQHTDMLDHILHTMACKAAMKAGQYSTKEELAVLVGRVLSGEIKYCPHGRPVMFKMGKQDMDKQCKRIV